MNQNQQSQKHTNEKKDGTKSNFVHLHRHSEYSLLDGIGKAPQYAQQAAHWGQEAMALTDHGNISGCLHHYDACLKEDVKPILGMEAYFQPDRLDAENKKANHLVLHAKNNEGWKNLIHLSSEAYRSGYKRVPISYKPIVDYELLKKYSRGLICSTACLSSYPNQLIMQGDSTGALNAFKKLQDIFGDDLFIEIMPHDFDEQRQLNNDLAGVANDLSIPLIATVDAHYPYEGWHDTQDIMLMVSTGQSFEQRKKKKDKGEDVYTFECDSLWLMPEEEVRNLFYKNHPDLPEFIINQAISNTSVLADRVSTLEISKANKMPKLEINPEKEILEICGKRLKELGHSENDIYLDRLQTEFDVIKSMNATDYIYIIMDAVRFARKEGIRMSPGRGSSAGSLLCYLTGITEVDPIVYGLLFERFLNPERVSMPDIDIDFQSDRVGEVEAYLKRVHGEDKVATVCAFQTFQPKKVLKAISKVYDVPFAEINAVTKIMDDLEIKTVDAAAEKWPKVDDFKKKNQEIWKHAQRIEGSVDTLSKHASAIVIMDRTMNDFMPTIRSKDMNEVTGWSDKSDFPIISDYGMLKIDALSTDSLKVQGKVINLIKETRGEEVDLSTLGIYSDPYDVDPEVMEAFSKGLTTGIWQFGKSAGMKTLVKNIQPDSMFDLAAANAIYRPGALAGGVQQSFWKRKHGLEKIEYFHPDAEDILKNNYGLIIYQEDVMKIVSRFGGFTGVEADDVRKAMGKEYRKGMKHVIKYLAKAGYEEKWLSGCSDYGVPDHIAKKVWELIVAFGGYSFNLSHAVVYACQAYQEQYLKVHYAPEYYTQLLSERPKDIQKIDREAKVFGIRISPPDINKSGPGFTIDDDKILFGLKAIKGIADKATAMIEDRRPFTSIEDFIERTPRRPVTSAVITALEKSGAFDQFGGRDNYSKKEILEGETEILGIPLSKEDIVNDNVDLLNEYIEFEDMLDSKPLRYNATLGGEVERLSVVKTKKGDEMAFIDLVYLDNNWSVTVFNSQWLQYKDILYEGANIMVKGNKNDYNDNVSYILNYVMPLEQFIQEIGAMSNA